MIANFVNSFYGVEALVSQTFGICRFAEERTMVEESFSVERVHDNGCCFGKIFMTPTVSVACLEHVLRGNNGRP